MMCVYLQENQAVSKRGVWRCVQEEVLVLHIPLWRVAN